VKTKLFFVIILYIATMFTDMGFLDKRSCNFFCGSFLGLLFPRAICKRFRKYGGMTSNPPYAMHILKVCQSYPLLG
jgi:hypothetical protein